QDALFNLLSGVFLLVVLLGIVNAMLMSVLERVREIGTMMAVGIQRAQVLRLFVLEGAAIGLTGSSLGALAGALLVAALHAMRLQVPLAGSNAPSLLQPYVTGSYLLAVVLGGATSAALAALWPATRASRLTP